MGKDDRKGARQSRDKKIGTRALKLGFYLIITDTEKTEKNYFEAIRDLLPENIKDHLKIEVEQVKGKYLIAKAKEFRAKEPQYGIPCIVFDRDEVKNFDKIIKEAEAEGIYVGWSNPCIEIWFWTYFEDAPMKKGSVNCCRDFSTKYKAMTKQEYSKTSNNIYSKLIEHGDETKAIERLHRRMEQMKANGKSKPSEMYSGNNIYPLIKELTKKRNIN